MQTQEKKYLETVIRRNDSDEEDLVLVRRKHFVVVTSYTRCLVKLAEIKNKILDAKNRLLCIKLR